MRNLDFSSWQAMLFSFVGIALVTLLDVVIRLVVMQSVQQRRDRENRQINEPLHLGLHKRVGQLGFTVWPLTEATSARSGHRNPNRNNFTRAILPPIFYPGKMLTVIPTRRGRWNPGTS